MSEVTKMSKMLLKEKRGVRGGIKVEGEVMNTFVFCKIIRFSKTEAIRDAINISNTLRLGGRCLLDYEVIRKSQEELFNEGEC